MSLRLQSVVNHDVLYSFQQVLLAFGSLNAHDAHANHSLIYFSNGCVAETGQRDCSIACQNASLIFGNVSTLHNCLLYPVVASALAEGALDVESVATATSYGVKPDLALGIGTDQISECLKDYCDSNSGCVASKDSQQSIDHAATLCDGYSGNTCYNHTNICPTVYAPVLDDIAGIGVSIVRGIYYIDSAEPSVRFTPLTGCRMG